MDCIGNTRQGSGQHKERRWKAVATHGKAAANTRKGGGRQWPTQGKAVANTRQGGGRHWRHKARQWPTQGKAVAHTRSTAPERSCSAGCEAGTRSRSGRPPGPSLAIGESSVIRLRPPLPLGGVSVRMEFAPCTFSQTQKRIAALIGGTSSPSMLKHLLKGEGGAAEWQARRRLAPPSSGKGPGGGIGWRAHDPR